MQKDKEKWDDRYSRMQMPLTPSDLLGEFYALLPKEGKALDLACGNGRNARFLATFGLEVSAIDISSIAIAQAHKLWDSSKSMHTPKGSLELLCLDLDSYAIQPNTYAVICNFYFLDRRLLAQIPQALKKQGLFFLETFEEHRGYPTHIDSSKILRPNELVEIFQPYEILLNQRKIITRESTDQQACVRQFIARI